MKNFLSKIAIANVTSAMIELVKMIPLAKPIVTQEDKKAVAGVLSTGRLASAERVKEFEGAFAHCIGVKHAIAASSGTAALHAALSSAGIKPGDEVLCPSFTFIATSNAILFCRAKPVFCDSEEDTFNVSPDDIERKLKTHKNAKALIVVHLYGLACDMEKITRIAKKYKLIVLEDCAQAVGGEYKGKKTGSFGTVSVFSFYATKNMTTGEGGMIATNDKRLSERCCSFINHGRSSRFLHDSLGYNYRMTNFQAALGLSQLSRLDALNEKRISNANYLTRGLRKIKWLKVPMVPASHKHVFHQYTIRISKGRGGFMEYLKANGIESTPFYPVPVHKQKLYQNLGYSNIHLPVTEKLAKEVLSLPVHPALAKNDLDKIIKAIKGYTHDA